MAADIKEASGSSSSKKDLDADQIQHLVNMALSNAYDTVSSWLQPPSAAVIAADEKLKMSDREFEKLAFRPLRLGVGAAAPSSSTPKEMYKLKQKLAGTKRKVDEIDSTHRKGKAKAEPEEDDEESKSQSVTKKPRLGGTSTLLAFGPNESVAKSKRKKKKKDKGHLDPGSVASEEKDASPPPGHASSSTSVVISERDTSSQALAAGTAREEGEGTMAERAEAQAGSLEPEALPPDVSEKKRKKKKRKTSGEEHGSKSKLRTSGGGDGDKDQDQGGLEDDEEWLGIPPPPPPPESDMGRPPKPSKPTRAPSPDLKSTTTLDSRIYRHRPPRTTDTPTTNPISCASKPSPIASPPRPFGLVTASPPRDGRTGLHSHPSSSWLPTLPNGDLSSPHKKKKRRKRALLDQAQALDEQSSEATLVSSSDHTARMTSPRE